MNSIPSLSGAHLHTYETIFRHPISHNLNWREVHSLLKHIGEVEEQHNGNLKVTRNGHTLLLRRSHTKDVAEAAQVMTLRHFLEQSEPAVTGTNESAKHWLLVIDHHSARIFRSEISGVPPQRILPQEPEGHMHTTHDGAENARGKEKPDPQSFFEPVAWALQKAEQIIVFGNGTGTSSEMVQFVTWLKLHDPKLAARIVGTLSVDEQHLTNDQLVAKANEFYANVLVAGDAATEQQDESWKKLI